MSHIESPSSTWADLHGPLRLDGVASQSLAGATANSSQDSAGWQAVISGPLAQWTQDSSQLEDDDISPPSPETMHRAAQVARQLCAAGLPAPQRVAATGDSGIVFARREGEYFPHI